MPNVLESSSTAPCIPSIIGDLALPKYTVDDCLYLGPWVISFLSSLHCTIRRSPETTKDKKVFCLIINTVI